MRQVFANSSYYLLLIVMLSLAVIGFMVVNHRSASIAATDAKGAKNQPHLGQEVLQVGTDLPLPRLQPLSEAYFQQTGVHIDWVPVVNSVANPVTNSVTSAGAAPNDVGQKVSQNATQNGNQSDDSQTVGQNAAMAQRRNNSPDILTHHNTDDDTDNAIASDVTRSVADSAEDLASAAVNSPTALSLAPGIDMLLMHSAHSLYNASQQHRLQPLGSAILLQAIPKPYQDPKGSWYGVTKYGRTIVYNHAAIDKPAELVNYAALASARWFGRLCMTALDAPDNKAIITAMATYRGKEATAEILAGWQRNMGQPMLDDAHILSAVEQGACEVGIVDSDAFWQYAQANPKTEVRLAWADQINKGTVTNTISVGALEAADNARAALRFMEWLVGDTGQALLAFQTHTFAVTDIKDSRVNQSAIRPEWTTFIADSTPLFDIMDSKSNIQPAPPPQVLPIAPSADVPTP